ncbi:DNA mismatch repair protein MutL [Syntrophobacter sp. SbD1]|nr:DNA mismatch repair protein MutL [Syntrophobacter sp. SbD1]
MGKIAILPDILCNQIAAGEVVERPAAVVKELIENSIDAKSSRIFISLIEGGRREIRVVDNGCGMSGEDALLSLERHATSKISSARDLDSISSLGFRGEAIPSIAAVSRFELSTREPEALCGTSIKVEAGVIKDVREKGCPVGTQVLVRDLFYCLPARRKFLRKAETEQAYITDQFLRISLANPGTHMQLQSQEKVLYDHPRCEGLLPRVAQVLGADIARSLAPIDFQKEGMSISGFVAPPDIQRTNSQSLFLYVNGRPVWDRLLQRAVLTAYEALIPRGKYPVAVIFVSVPTGEVDVNVHPAKREIRFRNPGEATSSMRTALFEALAAIRPKSYGTWPGESAAFEVKTNLGAGESQTSFGSPMPVQRNIRPDPGIISDSLESIEPSKSGGLPTGESTARGQEYAAGWSGRDIPSENPVSPAVRADIDPAPFAWSSLNLLGQLANSFILLEAPDGLVLIDQHAAHERIVFSALSEKSKKSEKSKNSGKETKAAQLLTRPAIVDLLPKEAVLLKSIMPSLLDLGFEIEPFGGDSFAIHAVPATLSEFNPEEILRDYLRYAEEECPANEGEILLGLARVSSCHSSVRAGRRLKPEEIKRLLQMLDSIDTPFTCPHGRPLSYTLRYEQIYRFFKRS